MDPVGVDPRWEKFTVFHDYLVKSFPLVYVVISEGQHDCNIDVYHRHLTLELTKVNTYGLIFVWKGSDATLKPLLLAGHQGLDE